MCELAVVAVRFVGVARVISRVVEPECLSDPEVAVTVNESA
jgi:hypothetical protein